MKKEGKLQLTPLLSLKKYFAPNLSPNKKKLAFIWDKTGQFELYVKELASGITKQISKGDFSKGILANYEWLKDDVHIVFGKDVDGNEKNDLSLLNTENGEIIQLTATPDHPEYIQDVSPDGKLILFTSTRSGQMNLFQMTIDDKTITQLTAHERPVNGGKISPDGSMIAYTSNEEEDPYNNDIYILKNGFTDVERIVQMSRTSQDNFVSWNDESNKFLFTTNTKGINQVGVYDLTTQTHKLFGNPKNDEIAVDFFNDEILAIEQINATTRPIAYNLQTEEKRILQFPEGNIIINFGTGIQKLNNDELISVFTSSKTPLSLIKFNLRKEEMSFLEIPQLDGYTENDFVDMKHIWYKSTDGKSIPALIMKPKGFDSTKSYQAVLYIHGGPTAASLVMFNPLAQILVDRGLIVLMPNYRGSTGYGKEFQMANRRDIGGMDFEDWSNGINYLVDHCNVDPHHIAIMGGSYGGYATLLSLTKKPTLWKFGVSMVPVSHWGNLYEKSMPHFKHYLHMLFGNPGDPEIAKLIEERSPLNYVENVQSPLLITHGTNDPRCHVNESRNFIRKLKENGKVEGKDFEYIEYTDEGHGGMGEIKSLLRTYPKILEYMYVKFNS